jgi:hypothetical protein
MDWTLNLPLHVPASKRDFGPYLQTVSCDIYQENSRIFNIVVWIYFISYWPLLDLWVSAQLNECKSKHQGRGLLSCGSRRRRIEYV